MQNPRASVRAPNSKGPTGSERERMSHLQMKVFDFTIEELLRAND
jgi:hypothetical protein